MKLFYDEAFTAKLVLLALDPGKVLVHTVMFWLQASGLLITENSTPRLLRPSSSFVLEKAAPGEYTPPVDENQKRKTLAVQGLSDTFFWSPRCVSLPKKETATLSHRRAYAEFGKLVVFTGSFLHPANSVDTIPLTENTDTDATDAAKAWLKTHDYILSNWKADEE